MVQTFNEFFCLLVVGVDDVAAHLIAEEPHIAGGAILIGPVGEIHTPRKAALGMALRLADDLEFVAAEVEAGKHLSADSLTVIVPPVVLFPRREPLRDMRREPPPEIGKIEQAGRFAVKIVPRLAAGFLQRREIHGETALVVAYAQMFFPFVIAQDERRLVGYLEARLIELAAGHTPRPAGSRGVADDKTGLLLIALGKYLPELTEIALIVVVESYFQLFLFHRFRFLEICSSNCT